MSEPTGQARRHRSWTAAAVVAVVVAAATIVWWGVTRPDPVPPAASTSAYTADPAIIARIADLDAALTSGDPARVQAAIVTPEGQEVPPETVVDLAEWQMTTNPDTWVEYDDGTATAVATTVAPDGTVATWDVAYLQTEDGTWKVVTTVERTG